jgi:hypothetical protein
LTWVATKSLETFRNGLQQKREWWNQQYTDYNSTEPYFSMDTPIATTGIEQGSQLHCYLKLPVGARTKQKNSILLKRERQKQWHARKCTKWLQGKRQMVCCATILIWGIISVWGVSSKWIIQRNHNYRIIIAFRLVKQSTSSQCLKNILLEINIKISWLCHHD